MISEQPLRVLITGAARAIGAALTVELADRGHEVIATARKVDGIAPYGNVRRLQLDVTDEDSVSACIEDPAAPLRVRVGPDADLILDTWKALSDADFEATMRSTLSLDW